MIHGAAETLGEFRYQKTLSLPENIVLTEFYWLAVNWKFLLGDWAF